MSGWRTGVTPAAWIPRWRALWGARWGVVYMDDVYVEYNFIEWLLSESNDMRMEAKMIARVKDEVKVREESLEGVERQSVDPHHHGRVHTPLPGPVTITEKGVEQGQVIG